MCILLFGINRKSPSDFRSLARIFLLPLELQSWAVRQAITGVAQLRSFKGRRKIRARDLKLLGEFRFIPNKRMHIDPKTSQKFHPPYYPPLNFKHKNDYCMGSYQCSRLLGILVGKVKIFHTRLGL